ncbi:hypothetical protein IFM61606_05358 [Aspergillus udagawae]|uniref:Uncharacterized protein n=1 Tax=Aspergillus udagawae TaxID=91492 RepID=A0A8E0QPN9_9EURO|nr:uncharacterized protein Aud_005195 [Aspergillus udagawae]GFF24522.1 hypothetical protein IFM46972_01071 [Aspergillus udagawae]GFF56264.1 hypothetical protein IFM51744_08856 [Aspergillus udagawae]GFF89312.1 hypothetical protein IFM53868_05795 [Aspergillus udagawae]GFG15306.1 hypothetical protein IFM5058_07384 [Aspergillus udagawae]GFG25417.1 hypothetical protein IFM61606_05358 [Aspergillus udagawae]
MQLAASFITCIGNYFSAELPEIAIHDGDRVTAQPNQLSSMRDLRNSPINPDRQERHRVALEAVSNAKRGGTATLILLGVTFSGDRRHKNRESPGVELPSERGKNHWSQAKEDSTESPGLRENRIGGKGGPGGFSQG